MIKREFDSRWGLRFIIDLNKPRNRKRRNYFHSSMKHILCARLGYFQKYKSKLLVKRMKNASTRRTKDI